MNSLPVKCALRRGRCGLAAALGCTLLTAALAVPQAAAQSSDPPPPDEAAAILGTVFLDAVNVVGTRKLKTLKDTPASVVVISREDKETYLFNDIEELIRYTPGVTVTRGFGADPFNQIDAFKIRGVGGNRVLTLVDGNRVAERIGDGTRNYVDLAFLRSVEIIAGPASILWGSDAMGGVVSYETIDPSDILAPGETFGGETAVRWGSLDNSFNETVLVAGRVEEFELLAGYSRWDGQEVALTKGRNAGGIWGDCPRDPAATPCDRLDPQDYGSDNLIGKLVWQGEANSLTLTGEFYRQTTSVDQESVTNSLTGTSIIRDYDHQQELTRWRISLEHDWQADSLLFDSLAWQVTYQPHEVKRTAVRLIELSSGEFEERTTLRDYSEDFIDFEAQFDKAFALTDAISTRLTYGIDGSYTMGSYDSVDVTRNLNGGSTTTNDVPGFAAADTLRLDGFALAEFGFFDDRLVFAPGLRYTHTGISPQPDASYQSAPGLEPSDTTYNDLLLAASLLFKVTDQVSVYAAYSEGFKTPTAQQLYTSSLGTFFSLVPNPDLKPESVRSFEIGSRAVFSDMAFSLTGFYSKYDDFIAAFQEIEGPDPNILYLTNKNISQVEIWGVEGSAEVRLFDNVYARTTLSYQHGDQVPSEGAKEIPYNGAEPFSSVTGLRYDDGVWGLELIHTYEAGLTRVSDDSDLTSDSYHVFDLVGYWTPEPWIVMRLGLFNLFDQRYLPANAVSTYGTPEIPSAAVAAGNPIEARIAPGFNATLSLTLKF